MRFLVDENVPNVVAEVLEAAGHELRWVSRDYAAAVDPEVLAVAEPDEVVLTEDKDFGDLIFRDHLPSWGVLLIRLRGLRPRTKAEAVQAVVNDLPESLRGCFGVLDPGGLRIRKVHSDSSSSEGEP